MLEPSRAALMAVRLLPTPQPTHSSKSTGGDAPVPQAVQRVALLGDAAPPELHIPGHVSQAGAGVGGEPREAVQVAALQGQLNQLLQARAQLARMCGLPCLRPPRPDAGQQHRGMRGASAEACVENGE